MQVDLPQDGAHFYSYKSNLCAFFPLPAENQYRIIALILQNPDLRQFAQDCSGLPLEIKKTIWSSAFTVHRRIVSKMRIGRIFLLGDAAHIHSPAGGQGLNTSVQEAFNLGWKVALVHQNKAPEALLDSFEQERLPIAKSVLHYTTLTTKIISRPALKAIFFPLFAFMAKKPWVQKLIANGLSELNIAYRPSSIIAKDTDPKWKGPQPGMRAPDAILADQRRLFLLLCHPLHTLLCFGDEEFRPSSAFLPMINIVRIARDNAGGAGKIYATSTPCCYLIRPDGVIAFRSRSLDPEPLNAYLGRVFK